METPLPEPVPIPIDKKVLARRKELKTNLKDWFGKDWDVLDTNKQEAVLDVYDDITKSELLDPLETIRKLYTKEFSYGVGVIVGLWGISLSLLASLIQTSLSQLNPSLYAIAIMVIFCLTSYGLVNVFKSNSRGEAKHWKLLEALLLKAEEIDKHSTKA